MMWSMRHCPIGTLRKNDWRKNGRSSAPQTLQSISRLFDIIDAIATRISREHALIKHPGFRQTLSRYLQPSNPERARRSKRLRIDRSANRLTNHVMSPCLDPGRGFDIYMHYTFELIDDQHKFVRIGAG